MSEPDETSQAARTAASRRRERAERLLGNLLPETTNDEHGPGWGSDEGGTSRDDELRRNVPPHHGND